MAIENLTPELSPDADKEGIGVQQTQESSLAKAGAQNAANGIGSKMSSKMNATNAASDTAKGKMKEEAMKKGAEIGAKALGTAIGGPLGTAIGYVVGKLLAKYGDKLPKIIFFALLGVATLIALVVMLIFSIGGDGRYFGSRPQIPPEKSNMEKVMAYAGDAASLRKLIVEKGDELIAELKILKTVAEGSKLTAKQKKDIQTKIDAAVVAVNEARDLLGGEGTNMSTAAEASIQKVSTLIGEVQKISGLLALYGDFYLPMGMLTCHVNYNNTPHTIYPGGHGLFIVQNNTGGGLDYNAPDGTPVYALADSYVYKRIYYERINNYIMYLKSEDGNYQMAYAHITDEVKVGDHFTKGEVIGHLQKGGMSSAHLHFEFWVKRVGAGGKMVFTPTKEREQLKYFCGGSK